MKILVVSAHPSPTSFNSALRDVVLNELGSLDHAVRHIDLYAEGFDPVFSAFERINHTADSAMKLEEMPELATHVDALRWCESIVFVYPTWWSGQPAILKGWFDRVLMKGVAWELPEGKARLVPSLANIRRVTAVTTHGSPKYVNAMQGESGKRTLFRSVRLMFNRGARCSWIAFYGLDTASAEQRDQMVRRLRRRLRRIF